MTNISSDSNAQSATHAYLEEASREFTDDPSTNLAILMIEHANESRHDARELGLAEEQHRRNLEQQQVQAMHAEADCIRAAGRAKGIGGIIGGIFTAAGGAAQFSASSPGADGVGSVYSGSGQLASRSGELAGSDYDRRAQNARADQTEFGHRIDASDRRRQDLDEQAQEALELRRTAIDHLHDVSESEANAARAVIFRG